MADKHALSMTISLNPWRDGLRTAGRKVAIPETSLWQAQNVSSRLDGQFEKAPGLKKIGQTIMVPDDSGANAIALFNSLLSGISDFSITDASGGKIILDTSETGLLQVQVSPSTNSAHNYTLARSVSSLSAGSVWSLRFMTRVTNVPSYTAASTTANTFAFRGQGAAGSGKEFAIWDAGLYYKRASDNTYVLIANTEAVAGGGWVTIEVRCDDGGGNTLVYVNDTQVLSIASASLADVTLTASSAYQFMWRVKDGLNTAGDQYSTHLITPMYNNTVTTPFIAVPLRAVYNYQYSTSTGSNVRALLLAAGDFIYVDKGLNNAFRPLHPKQNNNVFFTSFQNKVIWFDHDGGTNTALWAWDGVTTPALQDDAPNLHFGSEAHGRLFAYGPEEPLRLYYSGDRQLNQWFSPTEGNAETDFDTALNAGFLVIPSKKRGDRITAIYGGFFEFVIVGTKYALYKISGYGPNSFRVDRIGSADAGGASNEHCITDIGNDLAILGGKGIRRLSQAEQAEDIASSYLSIDIQNLWMNDGNSVDIISREFLTEARLKYNTQSDLLYAAVPLTGERTASNIYVYNRNTGKWLGPWTKDSQVLEQVELASPEVELMVHGGDEGRLGYTDHFNKWDFGDTAYTMLLESAVLDGRSLDPRLVGLKKTWKRLRLYIMPRGEWNITVTWKVPGIEAQSQTVSQNVNKYSVLTEDWRISDQHYGILRSREDTAFIEFRLDSVGTGLSFSVEQSGLGQDLIIQGAEVDFTVSGFDKEQAK